MAVRILLLCVFHHLCSVYGSQDLPTSGLFFHLRGSIYLHSDSVLIEDIGPDTPNRILPGDTLVCNTANVNTNCCRNIDNNYNGPIGDWFYPNNSKVIRNHQDHSSNDILVRIGYISQVRLVKRGNVTGPLGSYRCDVPTADGEIASASIYIISKFSTNPPINIQNNWTTFTPSYTTDIIAYSTVVLKPSDFASIISAVLISVLLVVIISVILLIVIFQIKKHGLIFKNLSVTRKKKYYFAETERPSTNNNRINEGKLVMTKCSAYEETLKDFK